jgi:hypothetical protein
MQHHIPEHQNPETRVHLSFINMPSYIFLAGNLNINVCVGYLTLVHDHNVP